MKVAGSRVWVAGHTGLVGGAIARRLAAAGATVLTAERRAVDLRRQAAVEAWLAEARPDWVVVAAATVGGIGANAARPADFLYDNLAIEANVIDAAYRHGVAKLVFLGSSCIYPREAAQPMREDALLTGPLEPTNQWYAVAKIAGIKLCDAYRAQHGADFVSAMPTNLYGPQDNFDLADSHVLPALIRRFHEARAGGLDEVVLWGSGTPLREFLHADDLADAVVLLAERFSEPGPINVGSGEEIAIADLARLVAEIVGYRGAVRFDATRPDGTPRKVMDSARLRALGWQPRIGLADGIAATYAWYRDRLARGQPVRGVPQPAVG